MGAIVSTVDDVISVVFILIIAVIVLIFYFIYVFFQDIADFFGDIPKYCASSAAIGQPGGPTCGTGKEYGGICYEDTWSTNKNGTPTGGVKTAICTVKYPGDSSLFTNCGGEIQALNMGDSCSDLPDWTRGPGWYKTALCTCQYGGIVTASKYCQETPDKYPIICPSGSDFYDGVCYKEACPEGYYRSAVCSCAKKN